MRKYDLAEIFTDIDDKFIASAKPGAQDHTETSSEAQKPLVLRPEPRSKTAVWKKCAVAAACLAVVAAGGFIAVNTAQSGIGSLPSASPDNPASEAVSLTNSSSGSTLMNLPVYNQSDFYYGTKHYVQSSEDWISYDGVRYDLIASKCLVHNENGANTTLYIGLTKEKHGAGEQIGLLAYVQNCDYPVNVLVSSIRTEIKEPCNLNIVKVGLEKDGVELRDADVTESDFINDPYICNFEKGEVYYQPMWFDTVDPAGKYNGTATVSLVSDSGEVIEHTLDFSVNIEENNTSDKVNSHTEAIKNATPISKWTDGSEFTYEGKTYKVFSIQGGGGFSGDGKGNVISVEWKDFVVGVRRDSADVIEFVAFIENRGNEPMGILSTASSPEKPILFKFDTDVNKDSHNVFTNEEFNSMPYILQPGETYYQKAAYNITEEEYMLSVCYALSDPDSFDPKLFKDTAKGGCTNRWADFADKSVDYDDVYKLFGSSKLSKELAAAAKRDKSFGGYDDDPGFSN